MSELKRVLEAVDSGMPEALGRLFELLKIDSISTDPAYKESCLNAANWLVDELKSVGFEAARHDTPGHPMVVGHQKGTNKDAPHLLFYGHYDVQPLTLLSFGTHLRLNLPSKKHLPEKSFAVVEPPMIKGSS